MRLAYCMCKYKMVLRGYEFLSYLHPASTAVTFGLAREMGHARPLVCCQSALERKAYVTVNLCEIREESAPLVGRRRVIELNAIGPKKTKLRGVGHF